MINLTMRRKPNEHRYFDTPPYCCGDPARLRAGRNRRRHRTAASRPEQQRSWLASRLVADMRATGMFSGNEIAETVDLVSSLTDEQAALLVRLYVLTREMAEQDVRLVVVESSETLVLLRRQIRRVYWEAVAMSPGCRMLCEVTYASIPGWCARYRYAVPYRYYRDGCYVGPMRSARHAGAFSVRVYGAYHDYGSRNDWHGGLARFDGNIGRNPRGTHGGSPSHATAAKKHPHPKAPNGPPTKHGKHPKPKHNAKPSAKHRGSSPAARHGGPRLKPSAHSQPHRQQPKQGSHAPKGKAGRHAQDAGHGQERHEPVHARHK